MDDDKFNGFKNKKIKLENKFDILSKTNFIKLTREFFRQDAITVAKGLIGKIIVRKTENNN